MFEKTLTGHITLEHGVLKDGFLALEGGKIVAIGQGKPPPAKQHLDFSGLLVMPGAIDTHTHAFSALEEGFIHLTRSAAAGGVTTVFDMPYDDPNPVTGVERLLEKGRRLEREASVAVGLYGTVEKGAGAKNLLELARSGVVAFKFSTFETHPVRFPRIGNMQTLEILEVLGKTNKVACFHAEDQELIDAFSARVRGSNRTDPLAHAESRPEIAELVAISGLLELAEQTDANLHIVHVTTGRGLNLIYKHPFYYSPTAKLSAETCLHYLAFTDQDMLEHGAQLKINPPLRNAEQQEGLWEFIEKLDSDKFARDLSFSVTSDHVAWPLNRKDKPDIFDNSSGMPGVETLLPFFLHGALEREQRRLDGFMQDDLDAWKIWTEDSSRAWSIAPRSGPFVTTARLLAQNPAQRFNLENKGKIALGFDADLAVLERGNFIWKAAESHSSAKWSPFDGRSISVRVVHTLLRGETVWDGQNVLEGQGYWLKT